METLTIHFERTRGFTKGKGNWAECTTPNGELFTVGARAPFTAQDRPEGGVIYQMLIKLVDAGYEGWKFEAHDGRMVCLLGTIDKRHVPTKYGGIKRNAP